MEKLPLVQSGITGEEGFEHTVIVGNANNSELEANEELSRRQRVILLQDRFGFQGDFNLPKLGKLINVDIPTIDRYISRHGVRTDEFEKIQEVLENMLTVSAWCVSYFPDENQYIERRTALHDLNRRVKRKHGIDPLKENRSDLLVAEIDATKNFQLEQFHDI